jgi:hypothetical protein
MPNVTNELLDMLSKAFPPIPPREQMELEAKDLHFELGRQDVIAWLKQQQNWSIQDDLLSGQS